ncbi:Ti-type conjugative transfer relaxase TraA [Rhizobium sp. BK313]|uniref:Ti-type conjugative transfer relaxase TraA n=1 Tax=Rhizobium sp. BK313 TaxID=2587081 RepID=UPI0010613FFC|nr:Ti-type conjugative transfer relaxase TraA [Rhizobium sp. BK313]MBB3458823.1 Ti-type conjugative transfer relaxase TraA [Rhizobium sp. BK313]
MAVPHFSVSIVSRGSGRSAVLSAAYRHCARMEYAREARTIDYTAKQGLAHEEFAVPDDAPAWLRTMIAGRSVAGASEAFWNRVETSEKRADAQLARDVTIALPAELSAEQNIALMRDFVSRYVTAKGMVADWVYHDAPGNPHVHLMTTLRPLTEDGFGAKRVAVLASGGTPLRNDAGKIVYEIWAGDAEAFSAFRGGWFECQNQHLTRAGLDIRIDGRSFEAQGIDLAPTIHLGVGTKAIERKAVVGEQKLLLERLALQEQLRADNARRIERHPDIVLDLISREKSVFTERDVAKILHRYIDDADLFRSLMARILQSPQTLRLDRDRIAFGTGARLPAKYTTRDLIRLEAEMANRAIRLSQQSSHAMAKTELEATFARHAHLSEEQRMAIAHVADRSAIAAVIGRAGAGKTTTMKAAREAWEAAGYRVVGGALAGKAAEGLEKETGIASRTLSSWELRWNEGRNQLDRRTVFVLDEAGMVSSRQMALFVEAATKTGAKLVLIGDPEQLQPIEAGAAFRSIAERIGYAELETIYRQRQSWMREASLDLARGHVGKAVEAYDANRRLTGPALKADAVARLIADWDRDYDPAKTTLILAHLRRDVRLLNELARARLVERGLIAAGFAFRTQEGDRAFAAGDQIVFLKNEASLGVKNGMLAKVVDAAPGRIVAEIGTGEDRRRVTVEQQVYGHLDHGYATTIHKSQGATVDQVKVLASLSLDRHLTYVAMTRHREDLHLYYATRSFARAGGLIQMLSRTNAKETTLDYERAGFYRAALRFAEARGLHLLQVARTMLGDRLNWTLRQSQTIADLGLRLAAVGSKLGLALSPQHTSAERPEEAKPMVSGITTFPTSIAQVVEERLAADPGLARQWQEVSTRFHRIYAQPETAFRAVNVDAMVKDKHVTATTLFTIANEPERFGALKGRTGLFAAEADRQTRETARLNVPALARNLERFLEARVEAERRYEAEERALRLRRSIDIPALSPAAKHTLSQVGDALERNDLPAALSHVPADKDVKAELDRFAKAVTARFGERTFLGIAAKDPGGAMFNSLAWGLTGRQVADLHTSWGLMRASQRLAAHERTVEALQKTEALRPAKTQGISIR